MKKKHKGLVIGIVIMLLLVALGLLGYFFLFNNKEDVDESKDVVLNKEVKAFTLGEADNINSSITSVEFNDDYTLIDINNGSKFDELEQGDIFMLDGSKDTPLNEAYLGKIKEIKDNGTYKKYVVEEPEFSDVFEEINIEASEELNNTKIIEVILADGVSIEYGDTSISNNDEYIISNISYSDDMRYLDTSSNFTLKVDKTLYKFDDDEDTKLKCTGEMNFKNIFFTSDIKWSLKDADNGNCGFSNLKVDIGADIDNKASLYLETKRDTNPKQESKDFEIKGLDEKAIPLAYIRYSLTSGFITGHGKEKETLDLKLSPLSVGLIVYIDVQGKITFKVQLEGDIKTKIDGHAYIVDDGKMVNDIDGSIDTSANFKGSIEGGGSFTLEAGADVNLKIFNINVFEVYLGKVGMKLDGDIITKIEGDLGDKFEVVTEAKASGRGYAKTLGCNVKISFKVKDKKFELNQSLGPLEDRTIFEISSKGIDELDNIDTYGTFNGHRYAVFSRGDVNSFEEAQQFCESVGGHLATITSKEEDEYVYSLVSEKFDSAYFGFTDVAIEGKWAWVTGEPVDYTNWASGEPNGENENEDYAMYYFKFKDGTWNDGDFGNRTVGQDKAFICEWDYE